MPSCMKSRRDCIPDFTTPEEFIDAKVAMLREDFYINVTNADIAHLQKYKTETEINAAVRTIIDKYWS